MWKSTGNFSKNDGRVNLQLIKNASSVAKIYRKKNERTKTIIMIMIMTMIIIIMITIKQLSKRNY